MAINRTPFAFYFPRLVAIEKNKKSNVNYATYLLEIFIFGVSLKNSYYRVMPYVHSFPPELTREICHGTLPFSFPAKAAVYRYFCRAGRSFYIYSARLRRFGQDCRTIFTFNWYFDLSARYESDPASAVENPDKYS